jgi:hypothetical protein
VNESDKVSTFKGLYAIYDKSAGISEITIGKGKFEGINEESSSEGEVEMKESSAIYAASVTTSSILIRGGEFTATNTIVGCSIGGETVRILGGTFTGAKNVIWNKGAEKVVKTILFWTMEEDCEYNTKIMIDDGIFYGKILQDEGGTGTITKNGGTFYDNAT